MYETHDNDPHTRHTPRLDPHRIAGALLCLVAAALVVAVLAALILSGSDSCPADLGAKPVRGIDGRTVCVVTAR
jgi:hypothetical protein